MHSIHKGKTVENKLDGNGYAHESTHSNDSK